MILQQCSHLQDGFSKKRHWGVEVCSKLGIACFNYYFYFWVLITIKCLIYRGDVAPAAAPTMPSGRRHRTAGFCAVGHSSEHSCPLVAKRKNMRRGWRLKWRPCKSRTDDPPSRFWWWTHDAAGLGSALPPSSLAPSISSTAPLSSSLSASTKRSSSSSSSFSSARSLNASSSPS